MVLLSRVVWKQGPAFAARLRHQDWTAHFTTLSFKYSSTKAAPQLPGMEYQVHVPFLLLVMTASCCAKPSLYASKVASVVMLV